MKRRIEKGPGSQGWLRPQSVVFTLLAEHLLGRDLALFSGSFIDVLGSLGITEHATRSTLSRMTRRGLLARQRRGRKIYYHLTPRCTAILQGGRERIWHTGAVNEHDDAVWTLLTFSLPASWQRRRYDLRSRLTWAGFGSLQHGVWLAPAEIDVASIIAELGLERQVRVFRVTTVAPTDAATIIEDTFDLEAIAERYREFIAAWRGTEQSSDALSLTLGLSTQWLRTIRADPRVPVRLLPDDWPAIEAQVLFRTLHAEHFEAARERAGAVLETVAADGAVTEPVRVAHARGAPRLP